MTHWITVLIVKITFIYNAILGVHHTPQEVPTPEPVITVSEPKVTEVVKTETTTTKTVEIQVMIATSSPPEVPKAPVPVTPPVVVTEQPFIKNEPKPCTITAHIATYMRMTDDGVHSERVDANVEPFIPNIGNNPDRDYLEWDAGGNTGGHISRSKSYGGLETHIINGEELPIKFWSNADSIIPTSKQIDATTTTYYGHNEYYRLWFDNGVECFTKTI